MAKKRHLYCRGNQYWFRVSVTVAHRQRVDVRFPLRTDSLFVSNQLCSILEGELARIAGREQKMFQLFSQRKVAGSSPGVPMSEIKEMVKKHFVGVLDEAHRKRRNMGLADWSPDTKERAIAKSDYLDLLLATGATRTSVEWQRVENWLQGQIDAGRMTVERAAAAKETLKARLLSGDTYPFSKSMRDWIPHRAGRELSPEDTTQLDILMLTAEREVLAEIEGDWRRVLNHGQAVVPQLPLHNTQYPAGRSDIIPAMSDHTANGQPGLLPRTINGDAGTLDQSGSAGSLLASADTQCSPEPTHSGIQPATGATLQEALDAFIIAQQTDSKNDKFKSEPQVRAMAKILFHVAGGGHMPAWTLRQKHLGQFVETLRRVPTQWGKTLAEQNGGIEVSLARSKTLPADEIGVSAGTEGRHLTMLQMFLDFCVARAHIVGVNFDVARLRRERSKQRGRQKKIRGRVNWTLEEVHQLLATPPFTGSMGPRRFERYRPGKEFYWDSAYWMLLILILQGLRSAEAGGLLVDHIRLDLTIPTIVIVETEQRDTKTESSIREVPIHPELLRLGFADFVKAVAAAGHKNLFPDLVPTAGTDDFAKKYYKSFILLRRKAFPNGTNALVKAGGREKDKDVHSARGFVITLLFRARHSPKIVSQLVGHDTASDKSIAQSVENEKINPTTLRYCDEATLETMLEALESLTPITQAMPRLRAKLNPEIYGRSRKSKIKRS